MSAYPIKLQRLDQDTEAWENVMTLHAQRINKKTSSESFSGGAEQYHQRLTFDVRWRTELEDVKYSPQLYRLIYRERPYNITDVDDYMEGHRNVRIVGEAYAT